MRKFKPLLATALVAALGFSAAASATDLPPQQFYVSAQVSNGCFFVVENVVFDDANGNASRITQNSGHITVTCNQGTEFSLAVDNGENFGLSTAAPEDRAMTDGEGHYVPYELFTDPGTNLVAWDTTNVISGTATGDADSYGFGIVIPTLKYAPKGYYSDAPSVTLTLQD